MANLEEIPQYKNDIIKLLVNNQEIVDTINNTSIEVNDDLIGKNILRDLYVPDVTSDAMTYICLGIFVTRVQDDLIKDLDIYFWIFSHQKVMDTGKGYTRVDHLQSEIDKIMNGNYKFGIDSINLKSSRQFRVNAKFGGVELLYKVTNQNQDRCGGFDKY